MLGIPVSLGILFLVYKRVRQITDLWFSPDQYARSQPYLKFMMRAGAFVLLFLGLIGPYWGVSERQVSSLGREIYILLDVSSSMNANDVQPTRLEKAKQEIKKILPQLAGDRVGLIVFTELPYVQCPLTQDHEAFQLFLDMAETDQFKQTGTQFRSALGKAVERLSATRQMHPDISQAVVVISDGEDYGDLYASLIERLRRGGISVYSVGVGTATGAQVPIMEEGRVKGYYRYDDGSPVISQLRNGPMRELAQSFGTEYVELNGTEDNLDVLADQIEGLASSRLDVRLAQVENNKYQAFLLLSVILLFVSMFLMPVRKE